MLNNERRSSLPTSNQKLVTAPIPKTCQGSPVFVAMTEYINGVRHLKPMLIGGCVVESYASTVCSNSLAVSVRVTASP